MNILCVLLRPSQNLRGSPKPPTTATHRGGWRRPRPERGRAKGTICVYRYMYIHIYTHSTEHLLRQKVLKQEVVLGRMDSWTV